MSGDTVSGSFCNVIAADLSIVPISHLLYFLFPFFPPSLPLSLPPVQTVKAGSPIAEEEDMESPDTAGEAPDAAGEAPDTAVEAPDTAEEASDTAREASNTAREAPDTARPVEEGREEEEEERGTMEEDEDVQEGRAEPAPIEREAAEREEEEDEREEQAQAVREGEREEESRQEEEDQPRNVGAQALLDLEVRRVTPGLPACSVSCCGVLHLGVFNLSHHPIIVARSVTRTLYALKLTLYQP